jgi:hypothetical protein
MKIGQEGTARLHQRCACFETHRLALLSMREAVDGIGKILILRKPRSGCLEGRIMPIQPVSISSHPLSRE